MIESLKQFYNEMRRLWGNVGINQKIALGIITAVFAVAILMWASFNRRSDYGLLFKNLSAQDAGEIVNALRSEGVQYRVEENGSAILVPGDMVYDLRLKLAGQSLPRQEEGWSLFDQNRLGGLSEFVQKVNHTRALQVELERTISSIQQIEWAKVHIVEAKDSLFSDKAEPASASVLIKTRGGNALSDAQVSAITYLISGAVRGLDHANVTVTDHSGRQLTRPGGSDGAALASSQLDYRRQVEEHLASRATQLLERVLGPGNAVVTVSADVDFSRSETHSIEYKDKIARSTSEITKSTTEGASGGVAGVAANLGNQQNANAGNSSTTREDRVEYMPPLPVSEQKRVEPGGNVKRLAAAVFVSAGTYQTTTDTDGNTVRQYTPAPANKIRDYEQIVKNAIGFDTERGDSLSISDSEFRGASPLGGEALDAIAADGQKDFIINIAKSASTAFVLLIILLIARRTLMRAFQRQTIETEPVVETRSTLDTISEPEHEETVEPEHETQKMRDRVIAAVRKDPNQTAQYLRTWMDTPAGKTE